MAKKIPIEQLRSYRHKVAVLKKKGLISKDIDARSVRPSSNISRIINKNTAILEGKARTFKVSNKEADRLKAIGFEVVRKKGQKPRVIVSKETYIRNGQVYTHAQQGRRGSLIVDYPLDVNWEDTVNKIFARLQDGDMVGFSIDVVRNGQLIRGNSYNMYTSASALIYELGKYKAFQEGLVSRLTVFKIRPSDKAAYIADGMERRFNRFGKRKKAA